MNADEKADRAKGFTDEKLAFEIERIFCRDGQAPYLREAAKRIRLFAERTAEADRLRHEIEHPHDAAEFEALRAERDAARRELCEMMGTVADGMHVDPAASVAASRGWSYLYETPEGGEG